MKAFRFGGLSTRKFAAWQQVFNVLCAFAALGILVAGVWILATRDARALQGIVSGRGKDARVDVAKLDERLETFEGGERLGRALKALDPDAAAYVVGYAAVLCRPGSLGLELALVDAEGSIGKDAREDLAAALGSPSTDIPQIKAKARLAAQRDERDLELELGARAVLAQDGWVRLGGVQRLAKTMDLRALPALLVALGAPDNGVRIEAECALEKLLSDDESPDDGTPEERWTAYWSRVKPAKIDLPYDLAQIREWSVSKAEERLPASLVPAAMLRDVRIESAALTMMSTHAEAPEVAAWALGRVATAKGAPVLEKFALTPSDHSTQIAAIRAIGERRLESARPALDQVLEREAYPFAEIRLVAAGALVRCGDRSKLEVIDGIAFNPQASSFFRLKALRELDESGDAAALTSRWIAALSDPDESVRTAAKTALAHRHRKGALPQDRAAWELWWKDRFGKSGLSVPKGLGG